MDFVIVLLFILAAGIGYILWRSADAKTYDPNRVDLSRGYDPKHDHFSAEHAHKRSNSATAMAATGAARSRRHDARSGQDRRGQADRRLAHGLWQLAERRLNQRRSGIDRRALAAA